MRGIQYSPLAESPAAHQQLTDNQRCPSLGEDFSCLGDRAELTVGLHPSSLFGSIYWTDFYAVTCLQSHNTGNATPRKFKNWSKYTITLCGAPFDRLRANGGVGSNTSVSRGLSTLVRGELVEPLAAIDSSQEAD